MKKSASSSFFHSFFELWIPFALLTTSSCLLVYIGGQQILRQGANDPQIAIARDISDRASKNTFSLTGDTIEMTRSLSTFALLYSEDGKQVSGTGRLNDEIPHVPLGVLQHARQFGENRVTWQPQPGVRNAIVVRPIGESGGFIVVGRSLSEVEKREASLLHLVFLAWLATISSITAFILFWKTFWVGTK